jgi:ribosome-binding factor A
LIRHALSDLLMRGDIHDPALDGSPITVPEVRCSPDLRNATVFIMPLGGRDTDDVLDALERNGRFIRGAVARAVNLKYAPQLKFKIDTSFDEADKVGRLLNSPAVRRDLDRDEGDAE